MPKKDVAPIPPIQFLQDLPMYLAYILQRCFSSISETSKLRKIITKKGTLEILISDVVQKTCKIQVIQTIFEGNE